MCSEIFAEFIVPFGASLFGAVGGALIAFHINRTSIKEGKRQQCIDALYELKLALHRQMQDISNLETFAGKEPFGPMLMVITPNIIPANKLGFMARAEANLLNEIKTSEHEYLEAYSALESYNVYAERLYLLRDETVEAVIPQNGGTAIVPKTELAEIRVGEKTTAYKALIIAIRNAKVASDAIQPKVSSYLTNFEKSS